MIHKDKGDAICSYVVLSPIIENGTTLLLHFLSLKNKFVLLNIADPDETMHLAAFHFGLNYAKVPV